MCVVLDLWRDYRVNYEVLIQLFKLAGITAFCAAFGYVYKLKAVVPLPGS